MTTVTLSPFAGTIRLSSEYDPGVVAVCREFKSAGARFLPENRTWSFPSDCLGDLVESLREQDCTVVGASACEAEFAKRHQAAAASIAASAAADADLETLAPGLLNDLGLAPLPYQRAGIAYAIERGGRALIADEMGLGKTLQALATAWHFKSDWPLLIVCPASLRLNWKREVLRVLPVAAADVRVVLKPKDPVAGRVVIASFDTASRRAADFAALRANCVVIDEAHYIKNGKAARTRAVLAFASKSRRVLALTGTPVLNRPIELWTVLGLLAPGTWNDWRHFVTRYCDAYQECVARGAVVWNTSGASNLTELGQRLRASVMVRRLKADVLKELPAKRRSHIVLEVGSRAAKAADAPMREIEIAVESALRGAKGDRERALEALASKFASLRGNAFAARSATAVAKAAAASEWITDWLEATDKKLIVFGHHAEVLDAVEAALRAGEFGFMRIDGSTSAATRQAAVDRFQSDPATRVALLSITAASTGLTLTAASDVAVLEPDWTPGVCAQAEDRAHRIGQMNSVNVYYLLADTVFDATLWRMLEDKISIASEALDGEQGAALVEQGIRGLLGALIEKISGKI